MSFLKRLFGRSESGQAGGDPEGFFFYVQCDQCGKGVRLRINKQWDLNRSDQGYVWHKTIVDSRCFQPMPTVVHFDDNYQVVRAEIQGGHVISQVEFEAAEVSKITENDQPAG